jgi:hypothetical protein
MKNTAKFFKQNKITEVPQDPTPLYQKAIKMP